MLAPLVVLWTDRGVVENVTGPSSLQGMGQPQPTRASPSPVIPRELSERHLRLAEITEMMHTASLVHDDVLDDCGLRRGACLSCSACAPPSRAFLGLLFPSVSFHSFWKPCSAAP